LAAIFHAKIDESMIEELETVLYEADLGSHLVRKLIAHVKEVVQTKRDVTVAELLAILEQSILSEMSQLDYQLKENQTGPTVILFVGANGTGKTTSLAKLAHLYQADGKRVIVAAADTFRAAAQEQLSTWADRLGVDIVRANYNADPAAVVYDGITAAAARGADVLLIDTAGRLENKQHLLKELEKMKRSASKALPGAPHEVLLVLDATIGQHGLEQAKSFHSTAGVTGLVLTKLDGTARGGVVVAIQQEMKIPVKLIGVGESLESLVRFDPATFVHALFFEEV
jgi:fused signal recognition particle receptor